MCGKEIFSYMNTCCREQNFIESFQHMHAQTQAQLQSCTSEDLQCICFLFDGNFISIWEMHPQM